MADDTPKQPVEIFCTKRRF